MAKIQINGCSFTEFEFSLSKVNLSKLNITVQELDKRAVRLYNNNGLPQLVQMERTIDRMGLPDGMMIDLKDEVKHRQGDFYKGLNGYYMIKKVIACRQSQSDVDLFWQKVICFQIKI